MRKKASKIRKKASKIRQKASKCVENAQKGGAEAVGLPDFLGGKREHAETSRGQQPLKVLGVPLESF